MEHVDRSKTNVKPANRVDEMKVEPADRVDEVGLEALQDGGLRD